MLENQKSVVCLQELQSVNFKHCIIQMLHINWGNLKDILIASVTTWVPISFKEELHATVWSSPTHPHIISSYVK